MQQNTSGTEKSEIINKSNKLQRSDAQENFGLILEAAQSVFEELGVDAPVREVAKKAGVGIGTLYRHFPERSDLIKAIVQNGIDQCANAAIQIASDHKPEEAIALWMQELVGLLKTKRGLATALHSGNMAYKSLPDYFLDHLKPALKTLLESAEANGSIKPNIDAGELLMAATRIATPASEGDIDQARRMITLLVDGLRSY
ncbi:TetR/AcrR family transcriptional regulator [Leptospira sp. 96542]|nr:TetR/AcrR family transcriptional regulator [Leptospira sp. 96542]